jgi:nucleoside-diphosphate-sugar epimerase
VNGLYRMVAEITGFTGEPSHGPARPGDLRRNALDISIANDVLDWRPWTHLQDGLGETVAYLRGV